jgi:hypothetical protein
VRTVDAATLDRYLTDSLLMEGSDALDEVAAQLTRLYDAWTRDAMADPLLDWLAGIIAKVNWWSGRLLGGLSFVHLEQEVPDTDDR